MENLNINDFIKLEPALKEVEEFVKAKDKEAKTKEIYWYHVWQEAKKMHYDYVGFGARNKKLNSMKCWDQWHNHLKSLTSNCL